MTSAKALKLDILLDMRKKGYNLIDGDKPEIQNMSLGGGYTLECNVKKPSKEWKIFFNDGIETSEYPANSAKVVYTYRKDADKLIKEYDQALNIVEKPTESTPETIYPMKKHEPAGESKKKKSSKQKGSIECQPGMALPIVYPSEMQGSFMLFKQWTANNDVIPKGSEVVLLDDDDYNYKVSITQACLNFDIPKSKAEIITNEEVEA